ncbi:MAG: lysine--tRNA ligase [Caulobacteraceae bacterium]|nr:lysine--tRNA ligase [Caulobacter sp.]
MADAHLHDLSGLAASAREARAWPFEQARALLRRVVTLRLEGGEREEALGLVEHGAGERLAERFPTLAARPVVLETGYGPSGLPHIGTFQEVARTSMVRAAFRALTGEAIPTELVCFSDDMDGLRKVPPGLPHPEWLEADLGKPLTEVRDPFEEEPSFGAHNNARLRRFLDGFGFTYTFVSSTQAYRSGRFDETLRRALARFDDIQAVMLPTLGPERRATYSPFLPISASTGRVLQVPTLERNAEAGTIVYEDEDGARVETPVTGGHVKLQWKPDWAQRWAALGVDYEMSGKDLIDSVKASAKICRILGGTPPEGFSYELYLDEDGQKISKSKNNGLTMDEWLRYSTPESLAYYVFQSPKSAKKLSWDVIPKATDEYLQQLDAYPGQEAAKRLDNPVWSVHEGAPPQAGSPVSFALMLNLVSAANAASTDMLWGFLERYVPGATPRTQPLMDRLARYALAYYEDFVRPRKRFRAPDARESAALADLSARFGRLGEGASAEDLQTETFEAGKAAGFDPLRLWFGALYEVLLGQPQGPRFGSFAAVFGVERTRALIARVLAGEDLGVMEPADA